MVTRIDRLSFGQVVINGKKYLVRDVIIFPGGSVRRRKLGRWLGSHHKFVIPDITDLVEAGAEVVVIGTGLFSGAKLSGEIADYAAGCGVEIIAEGSGESIRKFNELTDAGRPVGALLHILC